VLTDYVATRWYARSAAPAADKAPRIVGVTHACPCFACRYRAPEIMLGSTSYTKAVDMWAVGCILAEMFVGKPLLPGSSTMNQLEKVLEVTGVPTKEEIASIKSKYAQTMIDSVVQRPKKEMSKIMRGAPPEAIDLVENLMHFDPSRRLTVHEALRHPYMESFYQGNEAGFDGELVIPIDDGAKFSVDDYRDKLYDEVCAARKAPSLYDKYIRKR